jgi:hypothetical protein
MWVNAGNYDRLEGQATVNVPLLADTLYSRFSLYGTQRDGYVQDVVSGDDFGNVDRWGGQAQLRYLPSDRLLVDLNSVYGKVDQTALGYQCQPALGVPGSGWLSGLQDSVIVIPSTGKSFLEHCQDADILDKDKIYTPFSAELPQLSGRNQVSVRDRGLGNQRHTQPPEYLSLAQYRGRRGE